MYIDCEKLQFGENNLTLLGEVGKIEAKLHIPEVFSSKEAMIICCHPHPLYGGTMTNKVVHTVCKSFSKLGVPALRFNFRGVGLSEGSHDAGPGESKDLLILSDMMRKAWPKKQLWLAGFSFGAWIATRCCYECNAEQLLTIAPPIQSFDFNSFQKPVCPWLVLMGQDDEVVDPDSVFDWINAQVNPPQLIKFETAGHFFHGQLLKMTNVINQHYQPLLIGQ